MITIANQTDLIVGHSLRYIEEGWRSKLEPFLSSLAFRAIVEQLVMTNERPLTPPAKVWFRAFRECPYKDLKVVMMAQDPYPQLGVASGLAFDCSNTDVPQPSLVHINTQIKNTVYPNSDWDFPNSIVRWANQGVLLTNITLTTKVGYTNRHAKIWAPFTQYLLNRISEENNLIYCLWGAEAQKVERYISPFGSHIIKAEHPAAPAYRGGNSEWDCKDSFNRINRLISELNGPEYCIRW